MTEQKIQIRSYDMNDAPQLYEIDSLVWNEDNSPIEITLGSLTDYEQKLSSDKYLGVLVAEKEGTICGYINFRAPSQLESHQHVMEIAIAIHPQFQKLGIGRKLLESAYEWGRENGKQKISLRAMSSNSATIQFYHSCGYKEQGRFINEFYLNNQYIDDVFMYKFIK
ncbi:GNAT family N-acetyltransferase [Chengkuizengella axinellae]|uniref:GNAT family N-acetyltransferase n=1 Tax=Chengkuizengella axinellae TaxID=3064388 RepID=A0ABT9J1J7_9BACL|nr:GNAT family N-acetyltransferase [Chengkuizengella sp. 2205SS18-9]MDP5275485.1 GNAT family N-acetyltransferase [Chengkuizengella sp. 2205SS18-9]